MSEGNEGIIVTGGSFKSDQVAVGANSQAIKNIYDAVSDLQSSEKSEVARAISDLLNAVQADGGRLQDREEIIETLQHLAEEVKKEKPSKLTLKGLLTGIGEAVAPIAEIFQKVVVLKTAVAALTGIPIP